MKSVYTQYRLRDIPNAATSTLTKSIPPLQVKLTKKLIVKDASTNTNTSFPSKRMVSMEEIQNHTSLDNEAGTVENVDQKESDESFRISENESETDEEKSQHLPSDTVVL